MMPGYVSDNLANIQYILLNSGKFAYKIINFLVFMLLYENIITRNVD